MTATSRHQERTALMGMAIFVASWAMLFAALFFAYGLTRLRATSWPPLDLPRLPLGLPGVATLLLAASSWVLGRRRGAQGAAEQRRPELSKGERVEASLAGEASAARLLPGNPPLLAATLGATFLVLQTTVWSHLYRAGLRPSAGAYASFFFALTVFHALHVLVGVGALGWLAARPRALSLRLWTIYWHMVGVIWGAMYLLVYVL